MALQREDDPNYWGDNEKCRKCIFSGINAHVVTCDYSLITGRSRSIAEGIPGDKCDLWKHYPRGRMSRTATIKKNQRAKRIADTLMEKEQR